MLTKLQLKFFASCTTLTIIIIIDIVHEVHIRAMIHIKSSKLG